MRILDGKTSKEIDRIYIEQYGMPSIAFMEIAAVKAVEHIRHLGESFVIIVGPGNNGGDGLAIARHLLAFNKEVLVCVVNEKSETSKDYLRNLEVLKALDTKIEEYTTIDCLKELGDSIGQYEVVIDSIFGIGINRELTNFYIKAINEINEKSKYTISIDIPSGMDSTSGDVKGNVVKANRTITFQGYKKGFLNYETIENCGEIIVEELGVPESVYNKMCDEIFLTEEEYVAKLIPTRGIAQHKGEFGRNLIIAGAPGFQGSAYIAAESCIRSGAGLVTVATDERIYKALASRMTEAMCISIEDDIEDKISVSDSIAIGPGLGNNDKTFKLIQRVLCEKNKKIIIDADGINVLKDKLELLKNTESDVLLTPHPGEFARLIGKSVLEVNKNRVDLARKFTEEFKVNLILKGYNTVVASPKQCYINTTGNSSMANGGMGDCLTGIICGMSTQIESLYKSAIVSTYVHGYVADMIGEEQYVVNARDIIKKLPYFINKIKKCE